jgi:hypothetical protein
VVAATPTVKAEAAPGYNDWRYWWQATWNTPLSLFFLGFGFYQAESQAHMVLFFVMSMFFSPYLAGIAQAFVIVRKVSEWCRKGKHTIQLTPCGRYCCPCSDADLARDEELDDLGPVRPVSVRVGPTVAHSTMNDSVLDQTTAPIGF